MVGVKIKSYSGLVYHPFENAQISAFELNIIVTLLQRDLQRKNVQNIR